MQSSLFSLHPILSAFRDEKANNEKRVISLGQKMEKMEKRNQWCQFFTLSSSSHVICICKTKMIKKSVSLSLHKNWWVSYKSLKLDEKICKIIFFMKKYIAMTMTIYWEPVLLSFPDIFTMIIYIYIKWVTPAAAKKY